MNYAARGDVYLYGVARGSLSNTSRLVANIDVSSDTFYLENHGYDDDSPVRFRASIGGSLPSPIVEGTTYYVVRLNDGAFKVATTPGGGAVNISGTWLDVIVADDLPIDTLLEFYSRWVDDNLPAHAVPLEAPIPAVVRGIVAMLTAKRIQELTGVLSGTMKEAELECKAQLERFSRGLVERGATGGRTNLAVSRPVGSRDNGRGWDRGGGGLP